MEMSEVASQSFVVKVWSDDSADGGRATWHGHITNVLRDDRAPLTDLIDVADFIAPCLKEMGVRLGRGWRIRSWLCHRLM